MSSNSPMSPIQNQKNYACAEGNGGSTESFIPSSERDLLTHQTGHLLVTLGAIFVNVPSFSRHIDRNTGELLISLGNKLKARK